jgi:hypothetical protein
MDFPEMKYHAGGIVPSDAWIVGDEDTGDNPTVVIPRPKVEAPTPEEGWFLPF